ncbi:MAG: NADH-quinone oxidoreductase subunit L, partial [Demequinaceae bacterium]|nr:NADH-quinone oxidoreductase subunit L [Demequinaceae bacterium]
PVPETPPVASLPVQAARNDLFQDSVNSALLQYPGRTLTRTLVFTDAKAVDGAVNAIAAGTVGLGGLVRRLQAGRVRSYTAMMLIGVVIVLAIAVMAITGKGWM